MRSLFVPLLVLTILPAEAAPNPIVDLGYGVLDLSTQLEWLDLSLPARCTLTDLDQETPGCGFQAEGWQLATADMVRTLVANAGFPLFSSPPNAAAIAFIEALGPTTIAVDPQDTDKVVTEIWGITADGDAGSGYTAPFVAWLQSQSDQPSTTFYGELDNIQPAFVPDGYTASYWLARPHVPAVPEPASAALLLAGLAGVGALVRRRGR